MPDLARNTKYIFQCIHETTSPCTNLKAKQGHLLKTAKQGQVYVMVCQLSIDNIKRHTSIIFPLQLFLQVFIQESKR
jgi:hypothetical protein